MEEDILAADYTVISLVRVRVPQSSMAFRVDEPLDMPMPAKAREIGAVS